MEVRELEHFLAVVDSGGSNRAFALHVSQPPLSVPGSPCAGAQQDRRQARVPRSQADQASRSRHTCICNFGFGFAASQDLRGLDSQSNEPRDVPSEAASNERQDTCLTAPHEAEASSPP